MSNHYCRGRIQLDTFESKLRWISWFKQRVCKDNRSLISDRTDISLAVVIVNEFVASSLYVG